MESTLLTIAQKHLYLDTLETRYADHLDFHDHAVWAVKDALEAAYKAGQSDSEKSQAAKPANKPTNS